MRWFIRFASLAVLVASTVPAAAFCRATTCDPSQQHCSPDASGCLRDGYPVFWASDCITVSVQTDAAARAGIDYEALRGSVERAFEAWTSVECPGGGQPSLHVEVQGPVECSLAEYNEKKGNANIVMLRGDSWPYAGKSPDGLGYTRVHFDLDSGALYDADIELNGVDEALSVARMPTANEVDLDSVLTHEAGHLLGLDHTTDVEATMQAGYQKGSIALRTPSSDDIAGLCEIYPPGRKATSQSCEPRHGFSAQCGADQVEAPMMESPDDEDEPDTSSGCSTVGAPPAPWPSSLLTLSMLLARLGHRRGRR